MIFPFPFIAQTPPPPSLPPLFGCILVIIPKQKQTQTKQTPIYVFYMLFHSIMYKMTVISYQVNSNNVNITIFNLLFLAECRKCFFSIFLILSFQFSGHCKLFIAKKFNQVRLIDLFSLHLALGLCIWLNVPCYWNI